MITGLDRLAAAAAGNKSDRIPIFCNLLDHGARYLGISLKEYYSSGERVAEAQLGMREKYGHDNVWSLFYVGKEAELLGCKNIIFYEDGPPNVGEFIVKTHEDVKALVVPEDIASHPAMTEQLKCIRTLKRAVGGRHAICVYVTASMTLPALLMGMEKWIELLLMGPADMRDELLEKSSELFRKQIDLFRKEGADVIVYSNPFGSTDFIPMRFFRDFSLPWMEKDLAPGGVNGVVYYCGMARMNAVIAQVLEKMKIGVYYTSPLDDLAEAKRIIAGRALTAGVINDIKLVVWTPKEIRAEVKRIINTGMPGGKFFFGTGVMPYAIPDENVRIMMETAKEFGSY